jgi:hypothetical protein
MMVILSFNVLYAGVMKGQKVITFRNGYSSHYENIYTKFNRTKGKEKILLQIYWKAQSQKERKKMFDSELLSIEKVQLNQVSERDIIDDGYRSRQECYEDFCKQYKVSLNEIPQKVIFILRFLPPKNLSKLKSEMN